jgi:hypothetical protein
MKFTNIEFFHLKNQPTPLTVSPDVGYILGSRKLCQYFHMTANSF